MIGTNCGNCCFLVQNANGIGCAAGQFCNMNEMNQVVTPGFCRLKRSAKWKNRQLVGKSMEDCIETAYEEMGLLSFDMVVIFDEKMQAMENIQKTLDDSWYHDYCKHVLIADLTGTEDRKGTSVEYVKNYSGPTNIKTDCVIDPSESHPAAIRRVFKMTNSNFVLVIPAGQWITGLERLSDHLSKGWSRAAFWHFPIRCGETVLVEKYPYYGLYLSQPYQKLSRPFIKLDGQEDPVANDNPFCVELQQYEDDLGLSLTWMFDRCRLV